MVLITYGACTMWPGGDTRGDRGTLKEMPRGRHQSEGVVPRKETQWEHQSGGITTTVRQPPGVAMSGRMHVDLYNMRFKQRWSVCIVHRSGDSGCAESSDVSAWSDDSA